MTNQADTKQEYKNEHLSVSVSRHPGSQVKLNVTVTPEAVDAAYSKAVKNVSKEISLPGFRKGKAPEDVVIKKFEKPIMQEWRQLVLQTGFNEALQLTSLQPFNNRSLRCTDMSSLSKNSPAQFTIEFEAGPVVPHIEIDKINLPHLEAPPITQENVDQVLRNLQLYHAVWEEIKDRGIDEGDFADLDIDNIDENSNICKDTRFEIKPGSMSNWMREMIIGKQVNESTEGESQKEDRPPSQPYENEEEEPEFKPTNIRITVKSIKRPILPELNEEFAKKTGASNVADLEDKIRIDLNRRANEKLNFQLVRILDEQLLNLYQFDVPETLVKAETGNRLASQQEWLLKQNAPSQEIQKMMSELEQQLPDEVEKGCRLLFLLLNFAKEHNLDVSQEEVISELTQQIAYGNRQMDLKDPEAVKARITQSLLLRKAKNHIIDHVLGHCEGCGH